MLPETASAGAERQALYLLEALRDDGSLAVELAYFEEGTLHDGFMELGVPMWRIGRQRRLALDLPRRIGHLRKRFDEPPDLVHAWLVEAWFVALGAARAWPETAVVVGLQGEREYVGSPLHRLALRRALRRADHAVANSPVGTEFLTELGLASHRVSQIGNGVPAGRVRARRLPAEVRASVGLGGRVPLIVAAGRAAPEKDYGTLLRAMAEVRAVRPDATLVVVGPTEHELDGLAGSESGPVVAVGWQSEPADFLNAADVVAISSTTEGHSNTADEALLLGRAVVTTDAGAHPALVAQAGGQVVPTRRPDLLAAALLRALERPPDPATVRATATRELDMARVLTPTLGLYERLIAAPAKRRLPTHAARQ